MKNRNIFQLHRLQQVVIRSLLATMLIFTGGCFSVSQDYKYKIVMSENQAVNIINRFGPEWHAKSAWPYNVGQDWVWEFADSDGLSYKIKVIDQVWGSDYYYGRYSSSYIQHYYYHYQNNLIQYSDVYGIDHIGGPGGSYIELKNANHLQFVELYHTGTTNQDLEDHLILSSLLTLCHNIK